MTCLSLVHVVVGMECENASDIGATCTIWSKGRLNRAVRRIMQDDDKPLTKRKRGADEDFDSEDSDGGFGRGASKQRAVRFARSTAGSAGGRSHRSGATARSQATKYARSDASGRTVKGSKSKGGQHSGSRSPPPFPGGAHRLLCAFPVFGDVAGMDFIVSLQPKQHRSTVCLSSISVRFQSSAVWPSECLADISASWSADLRRRQQEAMSRAAATLSHTRIGLLTGRC